MMQQHETPICPDLVEKAVAHVSPLLRAYIQEEDAGHAEKIAVRLGRSLIEWERKADFNPGFTPMVAERVQELVPESEYDIEFVFAHMRKMFFDLLGYFVATKHHELVHELMNDKVLDALEEEGFFEMIARERSLEMEDEEDEEYEDEFEIEDEEDEECCDEDECCEEDEDDEDYA